MTTTSSRVPEPTPHRDARLTSVLAGLSTWLTPGLFSVGLVFGVPVSRAQVRARNDILRTVAGRRP